MHRPRSGLSLLEVMLALAILGLALAAIGELMRIGARNAELSRDLTTAQMLCETKMNEVVMGMLPALGTAPTPIPEMGNGNEWLYSIETQQVALQGLLAVRVTVQQNSEVFSRPATFSLMRWMIDPSTQSTTTGSSTDTSSSTGDSSSSSGTSSTSATGS